MSLNKYRAFKQSIQQYTYPQHVKRTLSRAQQSALTKGRGIRTQQLLNKYYEEAQRRFIDTETPMLSRRKYINKLRYTSEEEGISIREAHDIIMHTFPFISMQDNYKYQIFKYVDRNELRKKIAEASGLDYTVVQKAGSKQGQVRVQGGIDLNEIENQFTYDSSTQSLVASFTNQNTGNTTLVSIRIVEGETSDEPNFIEIK